MGAVRASSELFLAAVESLQLFPYLLAGCLRAVAASERSPRLLRVLRCSTCDDNGAEKTQRGGGCEAFHLELLGGLTDVIFDPQTDEQLVISKI